MLLQTRLRPHAPKVLVTLDTLRKRAPAPQKPVLAFLPCEEPLAPPRIKFDGGIGLSDKQDYFASRVSGHAYFWETLGSSDTKSSLFRRSSLVESKVYWPSLQSQIFLARLSHYPKAGRSHFARFRKLSIAKVPYSI